MLKRAGVALLGLVVLLAVIAASGCGPNGSSAEQSREPRLSVPSVSSPLPGFTSSAPTPADPSSPAADEYERAEQQDVPDQVVVEPEPEPEVPVDPSECPT